MNAQMYLQQQMEQEYMNALGDQSDDGLMLAAGGGGYGIAGNGGSELQDPAMMAAAMEMLANDEVPAGMGMDGQQMEQPKLVH